MRYSKEHEWIRAEGDVHVCGITDYAQGQLGDVVYVEVKPVGTKVAQGGEAATVESVKAASEVYAPAAGEIVAANPALADTPALVNQSPTGEGWFFKIKISDPKQLDALMDEAAYQAYVKGLG